MVLVLLTIIHVAVCIFLIIVVLLQSGKAADLAGAFGGMGSQTAFGPRGSATLLSKATTVSAAVFMITSLTLSILATRNAGAASTILEKTKPAPATAPAQAPVKQQPASAPVNAPAGKPSVSVGTEGGKPSTTAPLDLPKPAAPAQQPDQQPGKKK
jgi:preprotein translocase subunit SecG